MGFQKVQGLNGRVYVPELKTPDARKHDCEDCFSCQLCSDDRCSLCRKQKARMPCKSLDFRGGACECGR